MIRVFIIDDEPKVRKALKTLLNSLEVGIEIVGEAENAIQGMQLVEQIKPDLLLLDVVMPGMDGLEMLFHLQEKDCQIVIISGYNDFNYVKKAINHNVVDYVLKPFDKSDIKKVIDKVIEQMKHRDAIRHMERVIIQKEKENTLRRQERIKQKIYQGKSLIMKEQIELPHYSTYGEWSLYIFFIRNYYSELVNKYQSDESLFSYIVVKYIEEILDSNGIPHIVGASIKKSHLVYWVSVPPFMLYDFQLEEILHALKKTLKVDGIAIKNSTHVRREDLSKAIRRIETNIIHLDISLLSEHRVLKMAEQQVISVSDEMLIEINKFTKEVHFFVSHGLRDQVLSVVNEHLMNWSNHQILTVHFFYMLKSSIASIFNHNSANDDELDPFLFGMKIQLNMNMASAYILRFVKDSLNSGDLQEQQVRQDRIEIIKQYIELHYSESLSLNDLAKKFYISKEYLATSFKKKFDTTVHQYIQKVRLNKSMDLLNEGHYRISNIALMVGYDNFSYFNKLFRREFGITPSEYRENKAH